MTSEELWSLDCPHCNKEIQKPISWFRQPDNVCPHCSKPLDPEQVDAIIDDIKKNLAALSKDMDFNL